MDLEKCLIVRLSLAILLIYGLYVEDPKEKAR